MCQRADQQPLELRGANRPAGVPGIDQRLAGPIEADELGVGSGKREAARELADRQRDRGVTDADVQPDASAAETAGSSSSAPKLERGKLQVWPP